MSARAIPAAEAPRAEESVTTDPRIPRARRGRAARVIRLPGPEALLHPRAAEALILAFRPLSWSR